MQRYHLTIALIAASVIALLSFLTFSAIGKVAASPEPPGDSWRMYSFSPDGRNPIDVQDNGFWLRINGTSIDGRICNGFGGSIQYVDASIIRIWEMFSTSTLCGTLNGEESKIMGVEDAFYKGLKNGMTLTEKGDTLVLADRVTNATFAYGKPFRL